MDLDKQTTSVERLNYQNSILHPSVVDTAMEQIKSQLTTKQMLDLINGAHDARQSVARRTLSQIDQTLQRMKANHSTSSSVTPRQNNSVSHSDNGMNVSFDECTPSQSFTQQTFENIALSVYALGFMDDITIETYAQINKQCNSNSKRINRHISLDQNRWFFEYMSRQQHATKHMIHCKQIVFDFTPFNNNTIETHQDFLIETLQRMHINHIFRSCVSLVILSPSRLISRVLSEHIGALPHVTELVFKDIEIFPMIKIVTQIPLKCMTLRRLSMKDIHIKRDLNMEHPSDHVYTECDEWMKRNIDTKAMQSFIDRLLGCSYVEVSGWRNENKFWNDYLQYVHHTLDCSQYSKLSVALRRSLDMCTIKEVIYLPTAPDEDCIPHIWFKFMLQYKGDVIEKLKVDFAGSSNLYHAVFSNKLKKKLKLKALKELSFRWADRESYKFLNCVIGAKKNLDAIKLQIPTLRRLCKQEKKLIAAITQI